ncbi:hypothetical protein JB92DRAFT_2865324, partial [Gautieria morchelliformis]
EEQTHHSKHPPLEPAPPVPYSGLRRACAAELTLWSIRTCRIRNCKNIKHYWCNE